MNFPKLAPLAVSSGLFLAACATTPPPVPPPALAADPAMAALAASAEQIAKDMRAMQVVEMAANLPKTTPASRAAVSAQLASTPAGLEMPLNTNFSGPVGTLLQAVAAQVGWQFREEGQTPPIPLTINKHYQSTPAIQILRDLGFSIAGATVVVDPRSRSIVLRYTAPRS